MNNLPAIIRNLPFDAKSVGSTTALVLLGILCVVGALSLFALVVLFCWNNFWSPVIGLHRMNLGNAIWFTLSIIIILAVIIGIKEAK